MRKFFALVLLCFAALGCGPPPVFPGLDRRQNTRNGRIEGSVVVQTRVRGNLILFLFTSERPPPPQGTGRPIAFNVIPMETLFGTSLLNGAVGPFTAPFTFSLVPPGNYVIKGFIDRDACLATTNVCRPGDFIPWYGVTAEANFGDVGGAAVDPVSKATRLITVGTDADGQPLATTGVNVSFADSATFSVDRPVFQVTGSRTFDPAQGVKVLDVTPVALDSAPIHQSRPALIAKYVDEDANGVPDDANGDGAPDFFPKVIVRKLADDTPVPLTDENDLDRNGIIDSTGVDYVHASGPADGKPDAVVLAAGFDPSDIATATGGTTNPVPVNRLRLLIRPQALDVSQPSAPALLGAVPRGKYAIIVIQFTGQTWRVPNELQPGLAENLGLPTFDTQRFMIEVP